MIYYFLESSALVKLFVEEDGSETLIRLVQDVDDAHKLVSVLAFLEVRSAIRRRERAGEISPPHAEHALNAVASESCRIVGQPVDPAVIETARDLLNRRRLRTLDAIHLASCIVACDLMGISDVYFISSDRELLMAAEAEAIQTLDPAIL